MSDKPLITLHLGSREPKAYYTEKEAQLLGIPFDAAEPPLHANQPGKLKCRIKIRISPHSSLRQAMSEIENSWVRLDHQNKPAWVACTDVFVARMVSELLGGIEIRAWEPAEGDN